MGGLEDVEMYRSIASLTEGANDNGESSLARCSIDVQKAWTAAYPPNDKPMCLHAKLLELAHPESGKLMRWEAPPGF